MMSGVNKLLMLGGKNTSRVGHRCTLDFFQKIPPTIFLVSRFDSQSSDCRTILPKLLSKWHCPISRRNRKYAGMGNISKLAAFGGKNASGTEIDLVLASSTYRPPIVLLISRFNRQSPNNRYILFQLSLAVKMIISLEGFLG